MRLLQFALLRKGGGYAEGDSGTPGRSVPSCFLKSQMGFLLVSAPSRVRMEEPPPDGP